MKTYLAHTLFGIILVGSLIMRERLGDMLAESDNLEKAVMRLAQSHDLVFREFATMTYTDIRTILFDVRHCDGPVSAALLPITLEQEPLMRFSNANGRQNIRRYIYFDRSWSEPHYLAMFMERGKHAILAALGMTVFAPSKAMLLIESPPGCQITDTIDWQTLWNRDYLSSIGAAGTTPDQSD
jgi:hypothetical protein